MLSEMNHIRNNKTAEIVEEYISSLQELNTNSKPHINMLTLLAEDYIEYASAIVEAVEAHLEKVQSEVKLPVLYLIDSIIKNVNGAYLTLFTKNIVHTFCDVFEKVDENTRIKMWKLRQTWNEVFPVKKLFSLDIQVHSIDPAWPLSSLPPNAISPKSIIHVNPKFLSMQQQTQQQITLVQASMTEPMSESELNMKKEFLRKQQELMELQRLKPKLEMLLHQQRQLGGPLIHIKPELIASDGTLKPPLVPYDDLRLLENQSLARDNHLLNSTEQMCAQNFQSLDPSLQREATMENGICLGSGAMEEHEARISTCVESSIDSSLVSTSPVKICVSDEVPRFDSCQSNSNTDLSLIFNDNKSLDNDRNQRSSSSSQKTAIMGDAQQRNSSDRSSSKDSSARGSSSSSLKQHSNSSSLNSSCSRINSRSWNKSQDDNFSSSNTIASSISSSPSSYSSPHKKSSKSHQRSRSPNGYHQHHHQHRHSTNQQQPCLGEEFSGSHVSAKDSAGCVRGRKIRESSSRSRSRSLDGERKNETSRKRQDSSGSKDEDLRTALVAVNNVAVVLDSKEDLDLRVLPMTPSKRQSTELLQTPNAKKSKDEFDDLFGKEDVDLRLLNPVAAQSSVPQAPSALIMSNDKDGWAKLKMPIKSDSLRSESGRLTDGGRSLSDRTGRGRAKLYSKIPDERRRGTRDYERNADRNIEIIMKQAAEQLNQGTITKSQYNKLIQEVLHMSEDQKLRAAQRKERESKMWERNDKGMRSKDHNMHPRPSGGPRWQQPWHQPWAHPPGPFQGHFRSDFRPLGPWQNHPRIFAGPIRSDFHQFHAGFNPRLTHSTLGPNGPLIIQNGPLKSLSGSPLLSLGGALGPVPPGLILGTNGPIIPKNLSPNSGDGVTDIPVWSVPAFAANNEVKPVDEPEVTSSNSDQLPPADPNLLDEIIKDTMKSINIDNIPREIRYYGHIGIIFMHWDDPRDIGFQHGARRISIDGKDTIVCSFNDDYREFTYDGEVHRIKLGAPTRELYIDDQWYQCYFGGQPIIVDLGTKKISIKLDGPPPQVKIGTVKRTDLVLGKINLIINARCMVPVFLDSKPQMFSIDGKSCTLEFIDSLQTVLLNGRPLEVEFGGLPKPVFVQGKKHFIRFSVLPRGFRAGYVKITGMRGEQPKEIPPDNNNKSVSEVSSSTSMSVPSPSLIEPDSTSQDCMDHSYTSKSDLQLDVLSSVVTSAMAPSSGLSYQAEPVENTPAPTPNITLPLNLSELFQRLLDTGIVSNFNEAKKPEEEKKVVEIIPVSFDKPETLKIKQPAMVMALYSGIQCSSCGARFAPEMATRYSHHLDWHFRQNRKERDSSRKAHSRLWYYDVSDWIQFEEIEDLEDRAQSWFETEKQNMETENAAAEELFTETIQPSIPTGSDEDSCCQVCREAFEQFYNDEKEEWHLRPAISFENRNFHPLCLEDHKRIVKESTCADTCDINDQNKINVNIKKEKQEIKNEIQIEKQMDIEPIKKKVEQAINITENTLNEILETSNEKIGEIPLDVSTEPLNLELKEEDTDIEIPQIEIKEEIMNENEDNSENIIMEIEIKEECTLIKEELIELQQEPDENITETIGDDSTQVEVKCPIDENVELESNTLTIPIQTKIKMNMTNSVDSSKDIKEENKNKDEKLDQQEISVPLKPASIKPALCDRNLSILPVVEKGEELSALCSIM